MQNVFVLISKTTGAERSVGRGGVGAAMSELGACLRLVWLNFATSGQHFLLGGEP